MLLIDPTYHISGPSIQNLVERSVPLRSKATLLLIAAILFSPIARGQRCLDISISALMGQYLHAPGDPASNFSSCKTKFNENKQNEIVNYGQDLVDMDSMGMRMERRFAAAELPGMMTNVPSARSQQDAEAMAKKLQSMTPEQQKAWAMQYASQQMQATHAPVIQEDPKMAKLLGQVNELFIQMSALNNQFSPKVLALQEARQAELDKEPMPDSYKECPGVEVTGLPSCACANTVDGKYFQHQLTIEAKYDAEIEQLIDDAIKKLKPLVVQAEADMTTLRNGDALNNPKLKQELLAYQSSIFGAVFSVVPAAIENVRTSSSDLYVNKVNADNKVYNRACE